MKRRNFIKGLLIASIVPKTAIEALSRLNPKKKFGYLLKGEVGSFDSVRILDSEAIQRARECLERNKVAPIDFSKYRLMRWSEKGWRELNDGCYFAVVHPSNKVHFK